jgi:hypothetical protein
VGTTAHNAAMRVAMLFASLSLLAGCAGGPRTLGITGPDGGKPPQTVQPEPSGDPFDNPETLQSGTRYGPNYAPTSGGGHYWGYN